MVGVMGESKRNKARLGEWYGKPITAGHPDFPKPKPQPTMPIATQQRAVPERAKHETTNVREQEGTPQGTPVASEYITGVDPAMPGSDRTVVTVHRPNQSPAYHRVNRNAGLATMALLGCVLGAAGTIPGLAQTMGEPGEEPPYKPRR